MSEQAARLSGETVRDRLTACRKVLPDLFTRNWSGSDGWCFAVYTTDDSYVGSVTVRDQACVVAVTRHGYSKRDSVVLAKFCDAFNGAAVRS